MGLFVKKVIILLGLILVSVECVFAENIELCSEGEKQCTFVLLSEANDKIITINDVRAKTRLSPFSTFKIANTLIALETERVKNSQQVLNYDHEKYPPQAWWPAVWKLEEYNLASAFKVSMVAIFRQMAIDIGHKNMQEYMTRFDYGNCDISSGLDSFWLNGSLKISAFEQVQFLQKIYQNKFSVKANSLAALKDIMLVDSTDNYKIYAKTGAGKVADKSMLGWYVGFVENVSGVHYFAFNFNRKTYAEMKKSRVTIAMNHLKQAGVIN